MGGTPLLSTLTERIVYNLIMCLAGASFACMRLYVRYMHNRNKSTKRTKIFILGDVFLVAATLLVISVASVDIFQVSKETDFKEKMKEMQMMMMAANGGKPPSAPPGVMRRAGPPDGPPPPFVTEFLVLTLKTTLFYWFAQPTILALIKYSFLCHFWNISRNINTFAWVVLLISTIFAVAGHLIITITNFVICRPFSANWDPVLAPTCSGDLETRSPIMITVSVLHLLTDAGIMIIAYLVISQTLNLKRRQWSAVGGIYLIALSTMVIHATYFGVSITLGEEAGNMGNMGSAVNPALEKMARWMICMAIAEANLGLIALSLPSLRVWLRSYGMWSASSMNRSRARTGTYEMGSVHTGNKHSKWEASVITRSESETELANHPGAIMVTTQMEVGSGRV